MTGLKQVLQVNTRKLSKVLYHYHQRNGETLEIAILVTLLAQYLT